MTASTAAEQIISSLSSKQLKLLASRLTALRDRFVMDVDQETLRVLQLRRTALAAVGGRYS